MPQKNVSTTPNDKSAYFIAEFWLSNLEPMQAYSEQVLATLEPFNGKLLVRGNKMLHLEGETPEQADIVIIEFPSLQAAQNWYQSKAYQTIIPLRHKAGKTNAYIVEGLLPPFL